MAKMTITEALAEIKLITKKIEKKEQLIKANLVRALHIPDAFDAQGGSSDYIKSELQSCDALRWRLVSIRSAVAKANLENYVTVVGLKHTVYEWLTWKREIATPEVAFYGHLYKQTKAELDKSISNPQAFKDLEGVTNLVKLVPNVNYSDMAKKTESLQEVLDALDGQLSLHNATTIIDI